MARQFTFEEFYDAYPRVEEEFQAALDESLSPRGPDLMYDLVRDLELAPGSSAADVGCGEGKQSLKLAELFDFSVTGVDPLPRHVEVANEQLDVRALRIPGLRERVRFQTGAAESLPFAAATGDLVWCKDVLVHVRALGDAYREFRRVLRDNGRVLVYQSCFVTESLTPREAEWLASTPGFVPANADPAYTEAEIAAAGFRVDERIDVGIEWREWSEEQTGNEGRQLLHAARLLRDPDPYIERYGRTAYDIMLGDCLWHVYHMIGKVSARVYVLSPR